MKETRQKLVLAFDRATYHNLLDEPDRLSKISLNEQEILDEIARWDGILDDWHRPRV